jgi:uncharacterized OsmC-like protein
MPSKTVEISANLKENFEIELNARSFRLTIDQPNKDNDGKGPNPLEYFFFALAGCIVTISKIVAMQKKIDLRGIKVKVDGDLDTDVLNGKRNDIRAGFSRICANVEIDADLTQEEKEAFIKEVDSRCPISDNIENLSKIDFVVR